MWGALTGDASPPRPEVIHLPLTAGMPADVQDMVNASDCGKPGGHGCAPSLRVGKYKLLFSFPGEDELWLLDAPVPKGVPYGKSGGTVDPGTDRARGPHWKNGNRTAPQTSCLPLGDSAVLAAPCLFDVESDPSELNNLNRGAGAAQYAPLVASMTARLMAASADAAPYSDIIPPSTCTHRM